MKFLKYTSSILAAVLLFAACSEDFFDATIDLPTPEHTPIIAVSAFATNTDSLGIFAKVTRTFGLFEERPNDDALEDATVQLFENGELLYDFSLAEQEQFSHFALFDGEFGGIGNTYELKITDPTYGTATAIQKMPEPIPLEEIEYRMLDNSGDFVEGNGEFELTFQDPAGAANFYELTISQVCYFTFFDANGNEVRDSFVNNVFFDEDLEGPNSNSNYTEGYDFESLLISDVNFDGQRVTLSPNIYEFCSNSVEGQFSRYIVHWRTVTEEYFNYSKSLLQADLAENNPFSEPVSVFSNVEGGIGAFCLRSELRYDVE